MKVKPTDSLTKVCAVIYDEKDVSLLQLFAQKHAYKYYYIKHNGEADDEDAQPKDHYHFIIESDAQHRFKIASLTKEGLIPINLFQRLNSVSNYLRYMTHIDYDLKMHYDTSEIISNVDPNIIIDLIDEADPNRLTKKEIDNNNFNELITMILSYEIRDLVDLFHYCSTHDITYNRTWTYTFNSLFNGLKRAKRKDDDDDEE